MGVGAVFLVGWVLKYVGDASAGNKRELVRGGGGTHSHLSRERRLFMVWK